MPQSSLPHCEHVHDEVAQSSLQAKMAHAQQEATRQQKVPTEEVYAQEGARKELEIRKLHPMYKRRPYVPILDITNTAKWFAHDQFKSEN